MRDQGQLIGESVAIAELRQELGRIARSDAKVLITGESGVGKELVAREIHAQSLRAHRPFLPVNCAGLPETLLESELFGHVRGSFTGAYRDKPGTLETVNKGTVFLDEVGEMSLRMQGLLLRFLETGELQKVGADRAASAVDVRVIAATNRPLTDLIAQGRFREDLFYRLNVIHLVVPPLRERREDIAPLVHRFIAQFTRNGVSHVRGMAADALQALVDHHWAGNVRELENVIERLVVVAREPIIQLSDLPAEVSQRRVPAAAVRPAADDAAARGAAPRTKRAPRASVEELYARLTRQRESFWISVYPLYMQREITRGDVRELVGRGLEEARGNYKIMLQLFNMDPRDYKRFLNFLRKHGCQLPFKEYRQIYPAEAASAAQA